MQYMFGNLSWCKSLNLLLLSITESLELLSQYCSELLIHAADVEGLCQGIDEELVTSEPPFHITFDSRQTQCRL